MNPLMLIPNRRFGHLLTALLLLCGLIVVLARPAAADTTVAPSSVTIMNEHVDPIAGYIYFAGGPQPDLITAKGFTSGVQITVSGYQVQQTCITCINSNAWALSFAAQAGDQLAVGEYPNAVYAPASVAGQPEMSVAQSGAFSTSQTGDFQVRDITSDLSRLWITFRATDSNVGDQVFGEIRIGEPETSPGVLTVPSAIDWPDHTAGDAEVRAPIRVYNLGASAPITVAGASITGAAAGDYDLSSTGVCTSMLVGSSCLLDVGDTAGGTGLRGPATLTLNTGAGPQIVSLTGHGLPVPSPTPAPHADGCAGPESFTASFDLSGTLGLSWINHPNGERSVGSTGYDCAGAPQAWRKTVVRGAAGTTPPATPTDGFAVYAGRAAQVTTATLPLGTAYSFTAFAEYARGSISPASITVNPVTLKYASFPTFTQKGRVVEVDAQIWDSRNLVVCGAKVNLVRHDSSGQDTTVASGQTDYAGNATFSAAFQTNGDYRIRVDNGEQNSCDRTPTPFIGTYSALYHVQTQALVTAKAYKTKVKHGQPFKVDATLAPAPGTLYVEALQLGNKKAKFIRLATARTDSKGHVSFRVKLPKKGLWMIRTGFAGTSVNAPNTSSYFTLKAT